MIKDGYYLFIYSEINPALNVLAHSLRHDHNMAVFLKRQNEVELICHFELERFSGIKHHNIAFFNREDARNYINRMLALYHMKLEDFVGIYGMPGLYDGDDDISYSSILDLKGLCYHAVSHLFTSLMMDTEKFYQNDIIALAFDGGPDSLIDKDITKKPMFCGAVSRKGKVEYFPISSPGGYWLYLTNYFGKPEGTLMALAYATNARSLETFQPLPDYIQLSDKAECIKVINYIIQRIMSYKSQDEGILYMGNNSRFTEEEVKISMIMKVIQELSITHIFKQLDEIIKKYSLVASNTIIALSGGYALNCPTNTRIMNMYKFKEQLCVPCVNDAGLSIGMGLYFFYKNMEQCHYQFKDAYYGYSDEKNLDTVRLKYKIYIKSIEKSIKQAPMDIEQAPVVWIDGKAEIGPRALGHRSILASPKKSLYKDLLNIYKKREWWRPVAPLILEEDLNKWFENAFPSPFMLNNFNVKKELGNQISAVLHLDNTARVQTVKTTDDTNLVQVIKGFKQRTGIPILCNTSLNDKNEPIVNSIEEAFNFALRKGISIVYAYGYRIVLKNYELYEQKQCLKRDGDIFLKTEEEREAMKKKVNPHQLSDIDLLLYLYSPSLRNYDITKIEDAMKVVKILKKLKRVDKDLQIFKYWANYQS